jgi:outer membrane protein
MHTLVRILCLIALVLAAPFLAAAADTEPATALAPAAESRPAGSPATVQTTRIGYVDMARIAEEAPAAKALQVKLKEKKDKLQARIDAKRKQLDKLRSSLEAKLPTLPQAQREAKYREFQKKVEDFQKMARESEEELLKLQENGAKTLFDEIEQVSVAYGKANGLAAVVIKKELLYIGSGVDAVDVTEAIIKALNEAGQKK